MRLELTANGHFNQFILPDIEYPLRIKVQTVPEKVRQSQPYISLPKSPYG